MKNLSKEQIRIFREKINECIEIFRARREVNMTRERALTLISQICGDKSNEYNRFMNVGWSSFGNEEGYSDTDINTFISQLKGLLDCFDVFYGE